MTNELRRFTPRMKSNGEWVRMDMQLSLEDAQKIKRGRKWSAQITDLKTGVRYAAKGASCGFPSCFCDAIVRRLE